MARNSESTGADLYKRRAQKSIRVWDVSSGTLVQVLDPEAPSYSLHSWDITPDNKRIAAGVCTSDGVDDDFKSEVWTWLLS